MVTVTKRATKTAPAKSGLTAKVAKPSKAALKAGHVAAPRRAAGATKPYASLSQIEAVIAQVRQERGTDGPRKALRQSRKA